MQLSGAERETIVNVNSESDICYVHTRIPKHYRFLERRGVKPKTIHKDSEGNEYAWDFALPLAWFKMPSPKKHVGEAQRKAAGERMSQRQKALHTPKT